MTSKEAWESIVVDLERHGADQKALGLAQSVLDNLKKPKINHNVSFHLFVSYWVFKLVKLVSGK